MRADGMRSGGGARSRRRGGTAAAVVADSGGEKVGEREEVVVELTEDSFWAGMGRRWVVDGEGEAPGRTAMATVVWGLISAGVGHDRAHGWSEWVRGELQWLEAR